MSEYEVPEPILNTPFEKPKQYWFLQKGEEPQKLDGRRSAGYFYRDPSLPVTDDDDAGAWVELALANMIRERLDAWRAGGCSGASRTTLELLQWWRRDGRKERLFFAQLEAAETVIFLVEGRPDLRQGINVPWDEPSADAQAKGYKAFRRYACKMATGAGKTTVMGMLIAWSILNKINTKGDARFSDVALVVCPNVTIRNRLQELDPSLGEASLYRKRDLVPPGQMMTDLTKGRVIVTNWHVFEPQGVQTGGVTSRANKSGVPKIVRETVRIGAKTATTHGKRYLTQQAFDAQVAQGSIVVLSENRDAQQNLISVEVQSTKYVESDTGMVSRVIGREVGGKQNILVFNDEAHHAYRIRKAEPDTDEADVFGEEEEAEFFVKEATVWVDGLDRIHKLRGINFCVDLSATPYFLSRVGQDTNKAFPWVVSDFGLTDAIESGLVKIPQVALRDSTGAEYPHYFNIWQWILKQLTARERGGRRAQPRPEAILKWAEHPIAMLGAEWDKVRVEWDAKTDEDRPPVFILVVKNTTIAKMMYDWLAEGKEVPGIPPIKIESLRNRDGVENTIRVDSKVVHETDTGEAKSDASRWMRLTLDTVGKTEWPADQQGRPLYPEGFEELATKLGRPLHPPGRDVRCIISVGMLTEGWDCSTVTHIIGIRPFMSQLLCEQVVGRGLRRSNYVDFTQDGRLMEEVSMVLGVPFKIIPFKQSPAGAERAREKRHHVHAIPGKSQYEIKFPRIEGYYQAIRNRVTVNWDDVPTLPLDPFNIPPEVQMKALIPDKDGRPTLNGPGKIQDITLNPYRRDRRIQELAFDLAQHLTKNYCAQPGCDVPPHMLFPQVLRIVQRYIAEKVKPIRPAEKIDLFLSPYYGWGFEHLREAIKSDVAAGEAPEVPLYETRRGPGSTAEVDFWTSKDVREVVHCHLNYAVADTKKWEQSATYTIDTHPLVEAFVKNQNMGFAIPYLRNGEPHDYVPDFIIRLKGQPVRHLILETKGWDPLAEVKKAAAMRWVNAVNAEGSWGVWFYEVAMKREEVAAKIEETASQQQVGAQSSERSGA